MSQIDDFLNDKPSKGSGGQSEIDSFLSDVKPKENILGDIASTAVKGVIAVPEAITGLADIATGGRAGKALENLGVRFKDAKEVASSWESDATKQARQEFDQAEGLVGKAQAALSNPRLIAMGIGESVPSMLAGGALARTAGVALPSLAGRVGLTAAGEGAVMAGSQAEQIRQQTEDGLLTGKQAGLAAATGVVGGTLGALGGRAAKALGVGDVDQMAATGIVQNVSRPGLGIASRAGRGALTEGVFEELPQSLAETGLQNLALDRPFTQDMDSAAVMGTLTGGAMGAGAGVLSGMGQRPQAQPQPVTGTGAPSTDSPIVGTSTVEVDGKVSTKVNRQDGSVDIDGVQVVPPTASVESDSTLPADDVIDVEPITPVKPSEAMGIDRAAGPLSRAAADAVDSGASPAVPAVPGLMANPLVQAAQAPAPTPLVVDTASLKDRTTEELRGFLRNAQDTNIRKAISSELARRKREEMAAMPDPLQQSLIDQPKAEQPRAAEAPQAVQSQPQAPQEQPRPLASLIGGRLTDTDAADLVGKTRDPLRGVIQAEPRETGIQGAANGLPDTGVPAVTGAGAGDTQRPSGVSVAGRVRGRPGKRAVAPADAELAQGGADRAGDGGSGTGAGTAALNGRPARWRQNALQAKKVARELGLNPEGKRLAEIVAEVDAFDARSNVQDTPQGTKRVQAQAPADQAPEAARGDGAETGRVPDTRAGDGVRADGVEGYSLPEGDVWRDWRRSDKGNEHPEYEPSARQRVIMASVERAIDDGVFYNKEMTERVAKELGYTGPTDDGSVFKTDVYLARKTVEAKRQYANQTAIANELNLKAGDNLGTLIFNDFKVTTGVIVESVSKDGRDIKFTGRRGPARVSAQTQPESIKAAIDRAHEKGKRKDTYAEFVASRQQAQQPPAQETKPAEKKAQEPKAEDLPEGWTATTNGFTGRPVYRFTQDIGQPFAVVTKTDFGYDVQIRQGDKLVSSTNMNGAAKFEALDKATQMLGEAGMATHKDPGEKAEPATKAVVTDAMKTAAKNEETKPSEMRKWLLGEIDKALLNAPDRADYDEAVKRMGEKDAVSMFTGNGFLGKNAETGFVTFDVPGDGKFKVRNSVRGLLEFRKNVSASLGFKDSGQKTVKPEQNEGVRSGSGGQMAAITNMIEEGDFEAARDYAEAVGIKLEDVKVPRGERKPQWDQFLKDGTVPPPVDTRPLPPQRTPAQIAEDERLAKEAEAKKPKDTGWNMAGTGYGGKRYRGRNITTADGREIVARIYENAGNYDEVEVKVDGVRKFTVRDSYNAQDKADAFVKTLTEGDKPKADGVGRAVAGGQEGINGYFYKGGQFLPSTMAEPGKWKVDGKWVKSGRALIGPREYGYQPTPFSRSLFELAGVGAFTEVTWDGRLAIRDGVRTNQGEPVTGDMNIRPGVKGVLGTEELTLQEIVDNWNAGQRWFDVKPDAETVTTQDDEPTIPEGYKPAGEPFYRGGKQIQGYAPFNIGERVTMKDSAGQSGVIESLTSPDDAGVFSGALVKFDNGMEQIVSFGKLQAASAPEQTQATGTRRDPTKVSMFNPYEDGDIVTIDGQDWTVKQDTPGWYLTNTGNWRGTHPTIRNIKAMADLIREVEQASVAQKAAETEPEAPKLTQAEAKELMEWVDLGQKDGVKTQILTFYESKANKEAKRGRMVVATITKGDRSSTGWTVDGDDQVFGMPGMAKKRAMEIGLARAISDGFVQATPQQQEAAEPFEHAGLKIRQSRVRVADDVETRWIVQSPENAEREARGERQISGDRIVESREAAIRVAEQEVKRYADEKASKAEFDRAEQEAKAAAEARKEINRGKTLAERRADAILDKPTTLPPSLALGAGTKREAMQRAVEEGRLIREVMVRDTAAKKRDEDAISRVRASGYILGLSNENIPVVKAGLEAQARLRENKYEKPEYRVYAGRSENDFFREISKTEYDYAQSLKRAAEQPQQADKQGEKKPAEKIEDFGEKIGGAKKDLWTSFKDGLEAVSDDDIAGQPLSKIWPAPDYQALIDSGTSPEVVAFIRAARDEIPAKPRVGYKVKGWAGKVKVLRGLALDMMAGKVTMKDVQAQLDKAGALSRSMQGFMGRVELYQAVGHDKSLEGISMSWHNYALYRGQKDVSMWVVEQDAKATAWGNFPRELATGKTKEEAIEGFKKFYGRLGSDKEAKKGVQFEIISYRGEKGYWIAKKLGRNHIKIHGPLETVQQAREYRDNNQAELVAKLEKIKEIPNERRDTNEPRVGEDMRNGADVTPEMFAQTFGFRGVEFGNWVEQGRRQRDLNDAFDALMDMAAVLGIPPKAISLNGQLGLAFGARGTGGSGMVAAAHYEPDKVVINLTKKNGAGSLGHEWWHAVDNHLSKRRKQSGSSFMTTARDVLLAARDGGYMPYEGVRPEVVKAFGNVVKSINMTGMKKRAAVLDGKRAKEYWTTGEEMSARAFEAYLISKLQDQNASNDYLANIVREEVWNAAAALGLENENSYPYPTQKEIPGIRAAFDELFQTIQTRETDDGNVEMYYGTKEAKRQGTPVDRAVMDMAGEGRDANDILSFIAKTSKSPYRRNLARKLLATGANPAVSLGGEMGGGAGFRFLAKYSRKNHEVTLSEAAGDRAEQIFLHETVHAATLLALDKGGLQAQQMIRLYESAKKQGLAEGQYGMKNVGEFVAEAFTNPEFQKILKSMKAPEGNLWKRFVALVRRILGMSDGSQDMLTAALEVGAKVMRENMPLRAARSFRAEDGPAFAGSMNAMPENQAPGPQGDAQQGADTGKRVAEVKERTAIRDEAGKPIRLYHGSERSFAEFDIDEDQRGVGGIWFTDSKNYAYDMSRGGWDSRKRGAGGQIVHAYLDVRNPFEFDVLAEGIKLADEIGVDRPNDSLQAQELLSGGYGWDAFVGDLVADAKRAGHDALVIKNFNDARMVDSTAVVAFDQASIVIERIETNDQSAPDTDGADDAFFGIADASPNNARDAVKQFDLKQMPRNTWGHYRGMLMQALGRRQIVDLYREELPQLVEYDRLVQQMDAEKNDTGAEADKLATEWGKLDRVTKKEGEERRLAELMHDATLAQIDPEKEFVAGDNRLKYGELKARFDNLTPEAQAIYRQTRDMYSDHYNKVREAIKDRIERSELSASRKKEMMAKMDDDFFKKVKGVYFPLARFGSYVMVTKDAAGDVVNVTRAETLNEAQEARRQIMSAFPKEQGYTTTKVMKDAEFNPGRDAVGKGFMADLFETLDKQGVDEALRDSVSQLYLSSLPDLSWAKHGIHRKGTPGFSQDARRAFAQNMFHGARYLAKLRYADQMQTQLDEMQDHIKAYSGVDEYDGVQAQQVVDEMVKRHDFMMNPKVSPVSTALTSIGFVFHLGLSPASAMVNLSQTALVAYPIMGAKWGFTRASTALLKASREVVQARNDLSKALKGDELDAFNKAVKDGTIDVTMAHDLAGISQGEDQKVMWAMRPVMRAASFMFHHAERFNRQATFMAAYRLSKESGKSPEVAYEEAKKATYDGHYDYAASNRPRLMQGNWQKVIFLFKQYAQNMIYSLSRNAYLSVKGLDPAQRSEARKALSGILAAHAAAAGVLGLPLVGPLLAAASFIGGDDDEPWDAEVAMQNMMAEAFGPKAAEVIARGFSRLTPFDLSGRVALNKLILPDVYEGLEGQQWAESFLAGAAGPVAGIFTGMIKGLQKITDGDYQRGLEDMMPAALRGPLKALRYGSEGAVDKSGVVILDEVGPAGVASQALGFSPSNVRRSTERKGAIMDYDRALADRRSTLMRQWSEARMTGDEDGVRDVMEEIRAFNQKNPRRAITPPNLLQSYRARMKRINEADEGVYLPKNRRDAMDQVRF